MIAWSVIVFGFVILTISGNARPFLAPEALPTDGPIRTVGMAVALAVLGFVGIQQLEKREWKAAGRQAGLSPQRGGVIRKPTLAGTVGGRTVRAWTESRTVGGGGESGGNTKAFTVVQTDLSEPTERALIVTPGGSPSVGTDDLPADLALQSTSVGAVTVLGESDHFAGDVLTHRAQEAILQVDPDGAIHAGRTADIYLDAVEAATGSIAGSFASFMADEVADRMPSGTDTVGTEIEGVVLDGAVLERRAEAVAAVANGFEGAADDASGTRNP